jgi:flagellin-like protein
MTLKTKLEAVFGDDERAVSPVIGVILMVAITVILAAVIATFVTDLGSDQQQAPQASFSFEGGTSSGVTATHTGGDSITSANIEFTGGAIGSPPTSWSFASGSDPIGAGDSASVSVSSTGTLRVIYNFPGSDRTAMLATYEVTS